MKIQNSTRFLMGFLLFSMFVSSLPSIQAAFIPPGLVAGYFSSYSVYWGDEDGVTGDINSIEADDGDELKVPTKLYLEFEIVDLDFEPFGRWNSDDIPIDEIHFVYDLEREWKNPRVLIQCDYLDGTDSQHWVKGKNQLHIVYPHYNKEVINVRVFIDSDKDKLDLCIDYLALFYEP